MRLSSVLKSEGDWLFGALLINYSVVVFFYSCSLNVYTVQAPCAHLRKADIIIIIIIISSSFAICLMNS